MFKGAAAPDAQEYAEHVAKTETFRFETWDRGRLVSELLDAPDIGLSGGIEGPLLELLGRIDDATVRDADIERFTRRWVGPISALARAALECAVIATRARKADRIDLAAVAALGLVRAAWASAHGTEPLRPAAANAAAMGRQLFGAYAGELYARLEDEHLIPRGVLTAHRDEVSFPVTYHVRTLRLAELLSLYGLLLRAEGDARAADVLTRVAQFVRQQPGVRHPISDRWAVSLIPVIVAIASVDRDLAEETLRSTLKWVMDHYDEKGTWGLGLADVAATPEVELDHLLGGPLEHNKAIRRSASYLATVLIDLAGMLGLDTLYADAVNDLQAVDAHPIAYTIADSAGQYQIGGDGEGLVLHPHVAYGDTLLQDKPIAAHHRPAIDFAALRAERPWDLLAISALMRDRHWPAAARLLL